MIQIGDCTIHCGDALAVLPEIPDASVSLVCTDPPYHRVKDLDWDRQWKTDADYLAWLGTVLDELRRVLKPNGSLYLFASPQMAWGVEGEVRKRFNWLNTIQWVKDNGWHQKASKEELRSYLSPIEAILSSLNTRAQASNGKTAATAQKP